MDEETCQNAYLTRKASDINKFNTEAALTLGSGYQ